MQALKERVGGEDICYSDSDDNEEMPIIHTDVIEHLINLVC